MNPSYHGEVICSRTDCKRKAYYRVGYGVFCGYHCNKSERVALPKNPNSLEEKMNKIALHNTECERVAEENRNNGKRGNVRCAKIRVFGGVDLIPGYVNIFPNFKHLERKDGIGMPSLSPMSIGPIKHGQIGLPESLNLENFHQGNKVFPDEVNEKGAVKKVFFERQRELYLDAEPHRHKPGFEAKGNIPLFSIWVDKNGKKHKIDYMTSRQFYCHFYERSVVENPDFKRLCDMINQGYNLMIVGYDGYEVTKSLDEHYRDTNRPFGHELALYAMLTEDYVWRKYKTFDY